METEKSSIPLSPSSANFRQVGIAVSLLGLVACIIFVCPFVLQIAAGIFLGILMSSGETVVDSVSSPDHQITALIVSDGCGITCGCTVRVDLKTDDQYVEEIWRGIAVCDATVSWLNARELNILDDRGRQTKIDVRILGLSP